MTTVITAPSGDGFLQGLSTAFSAGSPHALAPGAILQEETALHITISFSLTPSVSTQIAALRFQLFESSVKPWVRVREVRETRKHYIFLFLILTFIFGFYRDKCRSSYTLKVRISWQH